MAGNRAAKGHLLDIGQLRRIVGPKGKGCDRRGQRDIENDALDARECEEPRGDERRATDQAAGTQADRLGEPATDRAAGGRSWIGLVIEWGEGHQNLLA